MGELDPGGGAAARYTATTIDHFQHPRNVGRLHDPDAVGHVDDPDTETTVTVFLKLEAGRVARASFRTFGCSACIAASSMATELLRGRSLAEAGLLSSATLDNALGGLPADKVFCADLVARAVQQALRAISQPPA